MAPSLMGGHLPMALPSAAIWGQASKLSAWPLTLFSWLYCQKSLKSHGNISGSVTQGIQATEVRELRVI